MNTDLSNAFQQLEQGLRAYLRRRLPEPDLADDLLQEVFVKALAAQQAGQRIDHLAGWLHTATRNTLVDYLRTAGKPALPLDQNLPLPEQADLRLHNELSHCLRPFLEQLPALYRDTLVATEFEGQTQGALARAQGVTVSAIKSRARRARAMLKDTLLACCRVEMDKGIVSHYQRHKPDPCSSGQSTQSGQTRALDSKPDG